MAGTFFRKKMPFFGGNQTQTYLAQKAIYDESGRRIKNELDSVDKLVGGIALVTTDDLNSKTSIGNYYASTDAIATAVSNTPTNKAFTLKVIAAVGVGSNMLIQRAFEGESGKEFIRIYANSTWGTWNQVARVTDNVATATKLNAKHNINGMSFDGSENVENYGVCSTAAATVAKTVTAVGTFKLVTGAEITVKFTHGNSVAAATLNVNNTGAKKIQIKGETLTNATATSFEENGTYTFRYDGTYWALVGSSNSFVEWEGTQAEYDAAVEAGTIPVGAVVTITDAPSPSGSSGHTIIDSSDNPMPVRSGLQFKHASVSDDETNNITVITPDFSTIAPAYSASASYVAGQFFIHNGVFYKVKTACSGVTPPNTTYYTAMDAATAIREINTAVNDIVAKMNLGRAGFHNGIFRGDNLGTSISSAQYAAIQAGTFDDMFIGDYWKISINGSTKTCRIAGFDCYLHCGDTELTKHHVVLVPDEALATRAMNSTATTAGGYKGSAFFTDGSSTSGSRSWCASKLSSAFGTKLLSHRELVTNAIEANAPTPGGYMSGQTGCASGWEWVDSTVELLSEVEVYGSRVWGSAWDVGIGNKQLPLFALAPEYIQPLTGSSRYNWWLRMISSSARFTFVRHDGFANNNGSADSLGIRPKWLIG